MEREKRGREKREGRREGRGGGGEMRKMKRVIGIMMILLIVNVVMISCGSGGPAPKDGQAAKADGTVIDLAKISKKIKEASEFAASVKEVHTLVKSIDELAKAIGKKIKEDGTLDTLNNKNGSLLAGVFQVILTVETKLKELEKKNEPSDELKAKITKAKDKGTELVNKLKGGHSELGIEGATDDNAQKAIDRVGKSGGDKGVAELVQFNTVIDDLLNSANSVVIAAIAELTTSTKLSD